MELYLHSTMCCFVPYSLSVMSIIFVHSLSIMHCEWTRKTYPAQTTSTSWTRALPVDAVKLFAFNMRKFSELV